MKKKALLMTLSSKNKDKELFLLDKLELTEGKTKLMIEVFNNLSKEFSIKSALVVLPKTDLKISRAVSNLPKIKTIRANSLNVLDILNHQYLIIIQDSIKIIKETYVTI